MAIKGVVPHKGLLVFKKGICKHSDSEIIRRNAKDNLEQLIKVVCEDWYVPVIPARFVTRWAADYYGQFVVTTFGSVQSFEIEINAPAFFKVDDVTAPFTKRKQLISTIIHELAHYIDFM